MELQTRIIGNDEGDVYCDVCDRRGWYQAIEVSFPGLVHKIVCLRRYEGASCADALGDAVASLNSVTERS